MAKKLSPRSLIIEAASLLEKAMLLELASIGEAMISKIIGRARGLPKGRWLDVIKDIPWKGEADYQRKITDSIAEVALDAFEGAQAELPDKRFKFQEELESFQLAKPKDIPTALEKLPPSIRKFIKAQAALLVGTQLKDLEQKLAYQWTDSFDTTDSLDLIEDDLRKAAVAYLEGTAIRAGSSLLSSKVVNESRNGFFFEKDVLEEIEAFEFVNEDPVTEICNDLEGTVFAKDDPEMFRYTPPLHWNCKSWIRPILVGNLSKALERSGQSKLESLRPSTKKVEETIQFSEKYLTENTSCLHP